MADNTTLTSGDVIRDLDRQNGSIKTQVMQIDVGGAKTNAESLVSSSNPMPVQDATAETALGTLHTDLTTLNTDLGAQADASAGSDTGTFSLIALFKRLLAKIAAQLPAALAANGGLKVEGVANGVAQNVAGTVIAKQQTDVLSNAGTDVTPLFLSFNASSSGVTNLVALTAGKRIRVLQYTLVAAGAVNVKFQSHTAPTDITGLMDLSGNGGVSCGYCPVGLFQTIAGEALDINLSGAVAVGGHLVYVLI